MDEVPLIPGVNLFKCELGDQCAYIHIVVIHKNEEQPDGPLVLSMTDNEYAELREWFVTSPANPRL
jgi:hypothetical protein